MLRRYTVDVVDTAGSPELFEHLAPGYIESSDAFVCVYSALNPTSLDFARGMTAVIREYVFSLAHPFVVLAARSSPLVKHHIVNANNGWLCESCRCT